MDDDSARFFSCDETIVGTNDEDQTIPNLEMESKHDAAEVVLQSDVNVEEPTRILQLFDSMNTTEDSLPERVMITIHRAKRLRAADFLGKSDPYVKAFIDGEKFFISKVQNQTLNPKWMETHLIPPNEDKACSRNLFLELWDCDVDDAVEIFTGGDSDDFLGCVNIELDWSMLDGGRRWFNLTEHFDSSVVRRPVGARGEICLSFSLDQEFTTSLVVEWLRSLKIPDDDKKRYVRSLQDHEVDGSFFRALSSSGVELKKYGIENLMHCAIMASDWRRIMREHSALQTQLLKSHSSVSESDTESTSDSDRVSFTAHVLRRIGQTMLAPTVCFMRKREVSFMRRRDSGDNELLFEESNASEGAVTDTQTSPAARFGFKRSNTSLSFAMAELLESEKRYLNNLRVLQNVFMNPLQTWRKEIESEDDGISDEEMELIFGPIPMLIQVHESLLSDLDKAYVSNEIGEVFVQFAPFLKIYSEYLNNYVKVDALLTRFNSRPQLFAFLRACELQEVCICSLKRYTSLPIHRIPQYSLLLREMGKQVDDWEAELKGPLVEAHALVDEVAQFINDSLANHARLMREAELRDEWEIDVFDGAARRLIKEGNLTKINNSGFNLSYEVGILLLSDTVVYGKRGSKSHRRFIELGTCTVVDKDTAKSAKEGPRSSIDSTCSLQLAVLEKAIKLEDEEFILTTSTREITFRASSAEEKDEWMQAFEHAIKTVPAKQDNSSDTRRRSSRKLFWSRPSTPLSWKKSFG